MTLWTLGDIKTAVRDIAQKKSTNQLSDSALVDAINRYYYYEFVLDSKPLELQDWWEFSTVASTDSYSFDDDNFVTIENPAYIDGYDLDVMTNPTLFYDLYPETTTYEETRPDHALFYGGVLLLRSPPDDAYDVKIAAWARPTTFTGLDDTATPTREEWGAVIAYGTARNILQRSGNVERLVEIEPIFRENLARIKGKQFQQLFSRRSLPKF